jgi:hypothetical protein
MPGGQALATAVRGSLQMVLGVRSSSKAAIVLALLLSGFSVARCWPFGRKKSSALRVAALRVRPNFQPIVALPC